MSYYLTHIHDCPEFIPPAFDNGRESFLLMYPTLHAAWGAAKNSACCIYRVEFPKDVHIDRHAMRELFTARVKNTQDDLVTWARDVVGAHVHTIQDWDLFARFLCDMTTHHYALEEVVAPPPAHLVPWYQVSWRLEAARVFRGLAVDADEIRPGAIAVSHKHAIESMQLYAYVEQSSRFVPVEWLRNNRNDVS